MFTKLLFLFSLLSSAISNVYCQTSMDKPRTIQLNTTNILTIRGTIDDSVANQFVYDLNKNIDRNTKYVYLDTNGGSVSAGIRIVDEIQKYNLNCIAHKAYSMGFVILQACKNRYITPYATVMQHQISYGVANEKAKIESYVNFIDQIGNKLDKMQSDKIGLYYDDFKRRTYNDWWLSSDNIIKEHVADEIVNVKCSRKLTNSNITINDGFQSKIFSKCPLVNDPIEIVHNNDKPPPFVFWI